MTNEEIRQRLIEIADEGYKKFSAALNPIEKNILGVRVPAVRALAKEVARGDFRGYLKAPYTLYHEERLLYGFVIGLIKAEIGEVLAYVDEWFKVVDNWAVCDCSVAGFKAFKKAENRAVVWEFLQSRLKDSNSAPYVKRACIVAMFWSFNDDEYVDRVILAYRDVTDEHYYIKMALSWGLAEIAIKHYGKALNFIKSGVLGDWVLNKGIQKACESFRLTLEQKQELKGYKRQIKKG